MRSKTLRFGQGFKVVLGNRRVQAAQMAIGPGGKEGGPDKRHRGPAYTHAGDELPAGRNA